LAVDKKTSGDLVNEGSGVSKLGNSADEAFDFGTSNSADLESGGEFLEGGTEELDTSNNLFGLLADEVVDGFVELESDGLDVREADGKLAVVGLDGKTFDDTSDEKESVFNRDDFVGIGFVFATLEEDLAEGFSDVKTELFPVTGVESINGGEDFVVDFNTVDQEVLEGVEDQRAGVSNSLEGVNKDFDILNDGTAALEGEGEVLEGLTEKGKSTGDISGVLFLEEGNSLDDVLDGIFGRREARSDIGPSFGNSDTFDNTLCDVSKVVDVEGELASAGDSDKA
jgi:hypothetical protein